MREIGDYTRVREDVHQGASLVYTTCIWGGGSMSGV